MEGRKSFLLRMSPDLWRELEAWAQQELRSVNGQIEYLLRQAVQQRKRAGHPSAAEAAMATTPERPNERSSSAPGSADRAHHSIK
jgi:hypothetical protein